MAFIIRRIIVRVRHDADEYVGYTKSIHRMAERRRTSQGRTPRAVPLVGGLGGGGKYTRWAWSVYFVCYVWYVIS